LLARDRLGTVHSQRDLVGIKIRHEVHHGGKDEGDDHAVIAAEDAADEHQEQRQQREQKCGLEGVSHNFVQLSVASSEFSV
jgi:hypothetical protein